MHFEVFSFKQWLLSHANMTEALLVWKKAKVNSYYDATHASIFFAFRDEVLWKIVSFAFFINPVDSVRWNSEETNLRKRRDNGTVVV
jgi:hypothetical protein